MERTLVDLSKEYYEGVEYLDGVIARHRKLASQAKKNNNQRVVFEEQRKLQILYSQRREALAVAQHLEHYYDKDADNTQYINLAV